MSEYVLSNDMKGARFFDNFYFFSGNDPTHGEVNYVDGKTANQKGYVNTS